MPPRIKIEGTLGMRSVLRQHEPLPRPDLLLSLESGDELSRAFKAAYLNLIPKAVAMEIDGEPVVMHRAAAVDVDGVVYRLVAALHWDRDYHAEDDGEYSESVIHLADESLLMFPSDCMPVGEHAVRCTFDVDVRRGTGFGEPGGRHVDVNGGPVEIASPDDLGELLGTFRVLAEGHVTVNPPIGEAFELHPTPEWTVEPHYNNGIATFRLSKSRRLDDGRLRQLFTGHLTPVGEKRPQIFGLFSAELEAFGSRYPLTWNNGIAADRYMYDCNGSLHVAGWIHDFPVNAAEATLHLTPDLETASTIDRANFWKKLMSTEASVTSPIQRDA